MDNSQVIQKATHWFDQQKWEAFPFQLETWQAYLNGQSGLVNAPTGSGKTYALFIPAALEFIRNNPENYQKNNNGLQLIWITPLRALTKEIRKASQRAADGLGLDWNIALRTGDTKSSERARQKKQPPEMLITTPESLHILLASKGYPSYFKNLQAVVIDEWHELVGSKRGVQVELALSRLKGMLPKLKIWGISATIGNMDESIQVLLGERYSGGKFSLIRSDLKKKLQVFSVLPDEIERLPWAGHLGIRLLDKVIPIIRKSKTTLIFTNTRAQCEIWYQQLLDAAPELAGWMAMHHGSISREIRDWVENALHEEKLKAVVCTSSLDLGVDFRPVETIIQIGSPKGVARFMQRAGRSGHQPGAVSTIHFVPTHALELIEASALRQSMELGQLEHRIPYIRSFDVLIQYLITLAVSEGFVPNQIFSELKSTFSYHSITEKEWHWVLDFITTGGKALHAYDEYRKVVVENGIYKVENKTIARRHRLSIGTIVSDVSLQIKYLKGGRIGTVEEWFIAQLKPGDVFWFAGRSLELVRVKEMTALVRRSKKKTGKIPAWMGGRIPLSSQLAHMLRLKIDELARSVEKEIELKELAPLVELQRERSHVPNSTEFLSEYFRSREGYHLLMYPFEGRFVHEGMGTLMAYRLAQKTPISFSIAMNDYGFELLSDQALPVEDLLHTDLFSIKDLGQDIRASINSVEMARRQFRDIASIAGLVFKGFPGSPKKDKHLQSSSQLFFEVFQDYDPDNLLYLQAFDEVMTFQLEEARLRAALARIRKQKIILKKPGKATPFAFPIMVDRLREKLSSEKLKDRIQKLKLQLLRD